MGIVSALRDTSDHLDLGAFRRVLFSATRIRNNLRTTHPYQGDGFRKASVH